MKANKNLVAMSGVLIASVFVVWFSTSIQGREETYRIEPEITAPEYKTDAARAIDAYERLMERYMNLTERNLFNVSSTVEGIEDKLDQIQEKLSELCTRTARIEEALGTGNPEKPAEHRPTANSHGQSSPDRLSSENQP